MRRFAALVCVIFLVVMCAVSASAASASTVGSFATVAPDGSCQVTVSATLLIDQPNQELYFPVPREATGVTLNGSRVNAPKSGEVRNIDLSRVTKNVTGNVSVNVHYALHDVIHVTEDGLLEMRVPLLSGLSCAIEKMEFSVTLPGAAETLPGFISGYHQANIEKDLRYAVEGATVSGSSQKPLKDHETLTMTMIVSEEMFPRAMIQEGNYDAGAIGMAVCGGLALLYWLLTMGNLPVWPQKSNQPPQGSNAGQLGCILGMKGADLSLMALDWAQLGYLLIRVRGRKVLLEKRMDMGNERSEFERQVFRKLFRKGPVADTSKLWYATLSRETASKPAGMGELIKRRTGNPRIFRFLASGIGLFGGVCMGIVLGGGAALQWLLVFLLAVAGAVSGWYMQEWVDGVFLHRRGKLYGALAVGGCWLLLGLIGQEFMLGLWMVLGLFIAGALLFWGGRRTELGRTTREQLFALRRYMRKDKGTQLMLLCREDPDYFFRMAPVAVALGVDRQFAKQFGKLRFERCPYLVTGNDTSLTATQWNERMRSTLEMMEQRGRSLPRERFFRLLRSITKT